MSHSEVKPQVWLVTGCSSGLGRAISRAALAAGHCVVVTARDLAQLQDFDTFASERVLLEKLDVTQTRDIKNVITTAYQKFGRIDVLVNNAGYGVVGAIEEVSENETRRIFETNVFGLMTLTRAVLPQMRDQKRGHIINISSVAGLAATPGFGVYNATKFAVEGLSEALAAEVAPFGIRVTIVEPGPFRTDFAGRSIVHSPVHPAYLSVVGGTRRYVETVNGKQAGSPEQAANILIQAVRDPHLPLRLPLGRITLERVRQKIAQLNDDFERCRDWAKNADYSS